MANPSISLWGATYSAVPGVTLPTSGGGEATFQWVEGSQTISENGTYDVTALEEVVVNVSGGGTPAISVVDTTDSHGGTIRTITALNISDSTLTTADQLAQGITAYNKLGVKLTGTGSGGGGATEHTIHLEFSDSTDTDIEVDYDDSWVGSLITTTTPSTYGAKTVTLAQLDGVTWYEVSPATWETLYTGNPSANADTPYNYFWISDLSDVYPLAGEVYRITADNVEYVITAKSSTTSMGETVCVGNPKYSGGTDDGTNVPFNFTNLGWGAWTGDTELTAGTPHSLKIERQTS